MYTIEKLVAFQYINIISSDIPVIYIGSCNNGDYSFESRFLVSVGVRFVRSFLSALLSAAAN